MADKNKVVELTADIVAAHISHNLVTIGDLPNLIETVHKALAGAGGSEKEAQRTNTPVVSARASIRPDYLICMECGRKQKTLRRHLQRAHGMTPEQYRKAYGLPDTYPMTAPEYSERRRAMAHSIGLGRMRQSTASKPEAEKS